MRFLILRSGDPRADAASPAVGEAMRAYEDDLRAAGVVLAAEELHPSRMGRRVDGPDALAGFYILQVRSAADALEWARRCPVELAMHEIVDGPRW